MIPTMAGNERERTYKLDWSFEPHVAADHLGRSKYTTSARALAELVANGLAAGDRVEIEVRFTILGGVNSIVVRDDGMGMTPEELAERFVRIGVKPDKTAPDQLARFGIGRLAVHRIGGLSEWSTVAQDRNRVRTKSEFRLNEGTDTPLQIHEQVVGEDVPLGTQIVIHNLIDMEPLTPARIKGELIEQFAAYMLSHSTKSIVVQDEPLDFRAMVANEQEETFRVNDSVGDAKLRHILLKKGSDQARFAERILFSAAGRTVATTRPNDLPSPFYLGIVEASCIDAAVSSNREGIIELDGAFAHLKAAVLDRVDEYRKRLRELQAKQYLDRARAESFYPFQGEQDAVGNAQQVLYDAVLEKVNEHAQLESMTKRQQAVVFKLLKRVLVNQNLLDVVEEVAALSDADVAKFKKVLERTTLESIVRLASEVTERLHFLDVLHELIYGENKKLLRERTQLHKILEPNCWIFGPQFHLAASDKSFREVVRRHRERAELPVAGEEALEQIKGVDDIPDLFLAAKRPYPTKPQNHHLLVEIKAPRVSIGANELQQIKRYGRTVSTSSEFDKTTTRWDVFIVSGKVGDEAEFERAMDNMPYGCLLDKDQITLWAFSWSEVIDKARREMQLVKDHLALKSQELTASDYLKETFPSILAQINAKKAETAEKAEKPKERKRKAKAKA